MKKFFKGFAVKVAAVATTAVLVAAMVPTVFAAFGPSRPTRVFTASEPGFDHVTFNSYTNVPSGIGDERDFIRGVQVGRDSAWSDPVANVTDGAEVEMKIYVHNNAKTSLNDAPGNPGIARNTKVRVDLPEGSAASQQTTAFISADNAQPKEIFDTLDVTGANNTAFEMSYVAGSAKMYDHSTGKTTAVSDSIVTTGANLGDQKGCFQYLREITLRVKVKSPHYMIQKTARLNGEGSDKWREVVNAKVGDKVDWRIWFKNAGSTRLENVMIVDTLPSYVTVVPGSVKLKNGNHPNGFVFDASAVQAGGKQLNIDIGSYAAGADAYLTFTTTIDNAEILLCGAHQIGNVAYATPKGLGAINDSAKVNVIGKTAAECAEKKCPVAGHENLPANSPDCKETPTELPHTGPAGLIGLFATTTVVAGVAHNLISRRKFEN